MSYISTPLLHHLSFSFYDLSISPSTLNYNAVTKYYDFNLQSGYKPSRMQNGLTTSRGGVRYVSSMIQVGTGRRCRTEHKRAARIKLIIGDHIAKLLKSTTAWVTAPCLTSGDDYFFFNVD